MNPALFDALAIATALAVGFALKHGGLCTYAAVLEIIEQRRIKRLAAFLGAAATTTWVVMPLSWWSSAPLTFSGSHFNWGTILAGGALIAWGAWLNRGCFFGTFVQLVGGNFNYLATLVGVVAGLLTTRIFLDAWLPRLPEASLATSAQPVGLFWLGAAFIFWLIVWWHSTPKARLILLILGIGGGWLYAAVAGWSLGAVLNGTVLHTLHLQPHPPSRLTLFASLAMVAGGLLAAWYGKSFQLRRPRLKASAANLGGGALMGIGAALVPGGNDTLLLHGIPALAPHAVVGYLAMLGGLWLLIRWASRGSP